MSSLTRSYVMGYWPIASNTKRPLEHYSKYIKLSFEMLSGQNLHFLSGNKAALSMARALAKQYEINLYLDKVTLDELPKRPHMTKLVQRAREFGGRLFDPPDDFDNDKGLIHYWRDLRWSDEETFKTLFCIWHSKVDLLTRAATRNAFRADELAWVDATVSRFTNLREAWDFRKVARIVPKTIHHYPNVMRKGGRELPLNASFLLGDLEAISNLKAAYDEGFFESLNEIYPNDEETVLATVLSKHPSMFTLIS